MASEEKGQKNVVGKRLDDNSHEILVQIFMFLDLGDQLSTSFVCVRWNHFAMTMRTQHHIWRTLPTDETAALPPPRRYRLVLFGGAVSLSDVDEFSTKWAITRRDEWSAPMSRGRRGVVAGAPLPPAKNLC